MNPSKATSDEKQVDAEALNDELASLSNVKDHYSDIATNMSNHEQANKQMREYTSQHHGKLIAWIFTILLVAVLFGYLIKSNTFVFFSKASSSSNSMALLSTLGCLIIALIAIGIMSLGVNKPLPDDLTKDRPAGFPTETHYNFIDLIFMGMHRHFAKAPHKTGFSKFCQVSGHAISYIVVFFIFIAIFSAIVTVIANL